MEKAPNCLKCAHFRITWDPAFPRACEVFGFKGQNMPSAEVIRSTGKPCPAFVLKKGLK
ncbi:MAG: hypothetical protein LBQ44_04635 [Treponema sp.]|nr:hypothetical protein [Treponema sp.]